MNDLISVGGVCFVAVSSAANMSDQSDRSDKSDIAESPAPDESAEGKRKYRPRGERSRKEQQRAASRKYYWEHRAEIAEKQKRYRADKAHRREIQRRYRSGHRTEINAKARRYYRLRKERNAT